MQIENDIASIAHYIQKYIDLHCDTVWNENHGKLLKAYETMGDLAYGQFLGLLFAPVHKHLKSAGFKLKPKLPGDLNISREWGEHESDRQRWMWSTIWHADGRSCGTIVLIVFHDHTALRLPRKPSVIFLSAIGKPDVIRELSNISSEFAQAKDMKAEYAEYLANLDEQDKPKTRQHNRP